MCLYQRGIYRSPSLQEKKIAQIADEIYHRGENGDRVKLVLISGPSSSGKTTFSKRLSVQLMTNGLRPYPISLDNYFVDREDTPLDENGNYDYESLYALDLELFNNQLQALLRGEEVELPRFNFTLGKKEYKGDKLRIDEHTILILEGIHVLTFVKTFLHLEHLHRSRFEMNHNFGHLGRHLLSGTDIKRHSLPTPVIHIQTHRHVGICTGIRTNILFFTITDTVITSNILSADNIITDILISQRTKGLVDLDHLVTETILVKLGRWFHGSNSKQLHQMVTTAR